MVSTIEAAPHALSEIVEPQGCQQAGLQSAAERGLRQGTSKMRLVPAASMSLGRWGRSIPQEQTTVRNN